MPRRLYSRMFLPPLSVDPGSQTTTNDVPLADFRQRAIVGPTGTHFAREAAGNAPMAPRAPAVASTPAAPAVAPGATGVASAVATPAVQFKGFSPEQGELIRAAGAADRRSPLGTAVGSARIIADPSVNPSRQISAVTNADGSRTFSTANGGSATMYPTGADTGESGIFVDGKAVTHDKAGKLVAAAPSGINLAQKFAGDQAVIMATYPQVGVAGSSENKKFLAAYEAGGRNQDGILDLAKSTFGVPNQQADVSMSNLKDVDPAKVAAARTTGAENIAAPISSTLRSIGNTAASVGAGVIGTAATDSAIAAAKGAIPVDSPFKPVASFFGGLRPGGGNEGGDPDQPVTPTIFTPGFKSFAPPAAKPGLSPTGTPVGPATNDLAGGTVDPVKTATDNLTGAVDASRGVFKGFGATANATATPTPAVDPAEELRRRQEAQRQQQARVAANA